MQNPDEDNPVDALWYDLLKSYNGTEIFYDKLGNPLTYDNGTAFTFTWKNGRELASACVSNSYTYHYDYGCNGLLIKR